MHFFFQGNLTLIVYALVYVCVCVVPLNDGHFWLFDLIWQHFNFFKRTFHNFFFILFSSSKDSVSPFLLNIACYRRVQNTCIHTCMPPLTVSWVTCHIFFHSTSWPIFFYFVLFLRSILRQNFYFSLSLSLSLSLCLFHQYTRNVYL